MHAALGVAQCLPGGQIGQQLGLHIEQAGDGLQVVLDAMMDFPKKHVLGRQRLG